jgi:hypothetical protein
VHERPARQLALTPSSSAASTASSSALRV